MERGHERVQALARRGTRRVGAADGGFTIVEVVVAFTLLLVVVLAMTESVGVGLKLLQRSKTRQMALNLAQAEIEKVRRIRDKSGESAEDLGGSQASYGYADIGTCTPQGASCIKDGNPPGVVPKTRTQVTRGTAFVITAKVTYIDLDITGAPTFSDAKLVEFTVTTENPGLLLQPVKAKTIVSPETNFNPGTVKVHVTDVSGPGTTPAAGVVVKVDQGGSGTRSDTTDASGDATFAGLTPSQAYNVTMAAGGWQPLSCVPATVTPSPLELVTVDCQVYRQAVLDVTVHAGGAAIPASDYTMTVTMDGAGPYASKGWAISGSGTVPAPNAKTSSAAGDTWSLSQFPGGTPPFVAGQPFTLTVWAPGYRPWMQQFSPLPADYPNGDSTETVDVDMQPATTGTLNVTVQNGASVGVQDARVTVTGGATPVVKYAITNGSGAVAIELEPGTYTISSDAGGGSVPATVAAGVPTDVLVTVP